MIHQLLLALLKQSRLSHSNFSGFRVDMKFIHILFPEISGKPQPLASAKNGFASKFKADTAASA
jgi:hypothetical protein